MSNDPVESHEREAKSGTPVRASWNYSNLLDFVAKAIVIGGPVFYLLGRIYAEAYWSVLGVPSSVLAVDAEDYIYMGFVVIALGIAFVLPADPPLWWLLLASPLLLGALWGSIWLMRRAKEWGRAKVPSSIKRLRARVAEREDARITLEVAGAWFIGACLISLAFLVASVVLLLPIVIAHAVGKKAAGNMVEDVRQGKGSYQTVSIAGKPVGRLLECPNSYCVVSNNGSFKIVRLDEVRWIDK
ncbi:MAG: hypothetical protein KF800_01000 [Lysobacter sp.]|nr:hypothetical protein [Lysobacter sp.]